MIVVDQLGSGESGGVFGSAAGRAIRMMATPGTHIADPFAPCDASDAACTAEQQALESKPRRLLSITAKKSVSAASAAHMIGVCVYEPALSQYRVWEWIEDKRWQMLFTVLAETAPVELCIDSAGDFPRTFGWCLPTQTLWVNLGCCCKPAGAIEALLKKACVPLRNVTFLRYPLTPPSQSARIGGVGCASAALVGLESYLTSLGLPPCPSAVDIVMVVGSGGSQVAGMKFVDSIDDSDVTVESKKRRIDSQVAVAWAEKPDVAVTAPSLLVTTGPHLFLDEASVANLEVGVPGVAFCVRTRFVVRFPVASCLPTAMEALKGRCYTV